MFLLTFNFLSSQLYFFSHWSNFLLQYIFNLLLLIILCLQILIHCSQILNLFLKLLFLLSHIVEILLFEFNGIGRAVYLPNTIFKSFLCMRTERPLLFQLQIGFSDLCYFTGVTIISICLLWALLSWRIVSW